MRESLRTVLAVACAAGVALAAAPPSRASVPDPSNCVVSPKLVIISTGRYALNVTVLDGGGLAMVGVKVDVDLGANQINYCPNQDPSLTFTPPIVSGVYGPGGVVSATTGSGGTVSFALRAMFQQGSVIPPGGVDPDPLCTDGSPIKVFASNLLIATLKGVSSPDFNANHLVNVSDLGRWAVSQSKQDACGDYDGNDLVNVADLGIFADAQANDGPCP